MKCPPLPSLLLLLAAVSFVAGCQENVQEVRRSKPAIDGSTNGYQVGVAGPSVATGGRYGAATMAGNVSAGPSGVATGGRYGAATPDARRGPGRTFGAAAATIGNRGAAEVGRHGAASTGRHAAAATPGGSTAAAPGAASLPPLRSPDPWRD